MHLTILLKETKSAHHSLLLKIKAKKCVPLLPRGPRLSLVVMSALLIPFLYLMLLIPVSTSQTTNHLAMPTTWCGQANKSDQNKRLSLESVHQSSLVYDFAINYVNHSEVEKNN